MADSIEPIEREITRGLPGERARWVEAARQYVYYECRNAEKIKAREAESQRDFNARCKLTSKMTRKVIDELARGLYAPGPSRKVQGGADAQYQEIAGYSCLNALMQLADSLAWLQGVFAVQVAPGGPAGVRLYPWRADEIAVWCREDDPRDPWAVCTVSEFPALDKVRFQLHTETEVRTYWTDKGDCKRITPYGDRRVTFDPSLSVTHNLGVLPFAFVPTRLQVDKFWVEGLGRPLADTNAVLDVRMSDLDQGVACFTIPEKYGRNLGAVHQLVHVPGQVMQLEDKAPEMPADIFYRQPDLQIESVWHHILSYANLTLQELDLPLMLTPESITQPESGVALMVRRKPLIDLWRARRTHFAEVEQRLASVILSVLRSEKVEVELDVQFPEVQLPMPTPERDTADEWELKMGLKSLIQITQERYGLTRRQAVERLRQVKRDRDEEDAILGPPEPAPGQEPQEPPSGEDDAEDDEDDSDPTGE